MNKNEIKKATPITRMTGEMLPCCGEMKSCHGDMAKTQCTSAYECTS